MGLGDSSTLLSRQCIRTALPEQPPRPAITRPSCAAWPARRRWGWSCRCSPGPLRSRLWWQSAASFALFCW